MKDLIFEGWRRFLKENVAQQVAYTGVVLSPENVQHLKAKIVSVLQELNLADKVSGWETSQIGNHGHEQLNHHMTLAPSANAKAKIPVGEDLIGKPVNLKIVAFGLDETLGIAAWQVDTDLKSNVQSGNPHITAMLKNQSVKPFLAGKITNWQKLKSPFDIQGTVTEVTPIK